MADSSTIGKAEGSLRSGQASVVKKFFKSDDVSQHDATMKDVAILRYVIDEYPSSALEWPLGLKPSVGGLCDSMHNIYDDPHTSDVCFLIHSRPGPRDEPKRIYAHSKILSRQSAYFGTMFESGFSEGIQSALTESASSDGVVTERCNVDTDSDYSSEEDEDRNMSVCPHSDPKHINADFARDAIIISREDVPPADTGGASDDVRQERAYKIVRISDTAALLYYLYTGSISFAPLKSSYNIAREAIGPSLKSRPAYNQEKALTVSPLANRDIPWTSPKSMYKLCDKLGIPDLKVACANRIEECLSPENVCVEVDSSYSALFPEIRHIQEQYMEDHRGDIVETFAFKSLLEAALTSLRPESKEAWTRFFDIVTEDVMGCCAPGPRGEKRKRLDDGQQESESDSE
ncbi:hypothetical protein GLOTRDRAFT_128180 [Gloeophyllum trabeum ATCC 11539]|uniref:BTB domain-containing protein n=1 Tax=Gloeophyllum trabeum (strain ATCC 11539 / FP-39264 / Madison 617) TaxID=670483 RepID=S7RT11_GLOTA|nr:uncharacterized protein GLOTRDRAFT_128180 [Gloeophyllum trabeum ATCC 11539]EPQ56234.1 hypothetical protein GLOTRDRAFT_128180 [Gloeophyllum trabeum ATCC 11539]